MVTVSVGWALAHLDPHVEPPLSLAMAVADGSDSGKKPLRIISLLISRSIRLRSCAEEKPHREGDAYINDAMVVALATSCNCEGGRPWQRKTLIAYMD